MSDRPILLFLHGVGGGDWENTWRAPLATSLLEAGYPGLDGVRVFAPKYANALKGVDDDDPLPKLTVKALSGEAAKRHRRDFERRTGAVEMRLGRHDPGNGWFGGGAIVGLAAGAPGFGQANNYLTSRRIRAQVLKRVLGRLPASGRIVVVGHSLGSVIAADVLRRLPPGLEVTGLVTIGSPLGHPSFNVDKLRDTLGGPPSNLAWWVNFWNALDPVTSAKGVSAVFPWMIDHRVQAPPGPAVHSARTYLSQPAVAQAIGFGLFGSQSKELATVDTGIDIPLDYAETVALLALRYAHLTSAHLEGDKQERYAGALRHVQGSTVELIRKRNADAGRPMPSALARLDVDLSDLEAPAPVPGEVTHLSKDEAIVPLISIAAANVLRPFEIEVPKRERRLAMEALTVEMGLGRQIGTDVFVAGERARDVLKIGGTNWIKWLALGLGAAAVVAATGGLALMAAPGAVGAAAVTSALAAFGPGGMIGGLLTAGTLVSAGGGGIAIGLASPGTSAETVEAVIATQLSSVILRQLQGIDQDPTTWDVLAETGIEVRRELSRLRAYSDDSAPILRELKRKLDAIDRALGYLHEHGLGPGEEEVDRDDAELVDAELVDAELVDAVVVDDPR
ncbi:hypothetical protein [Nocardioides sp. GY 10113]|uniref:hypothetical protein n=1 Tax=Nocardioides sp. GY 10113 TaxID=2569761 RepID=UPI00197FDDD2|nr:hypothetical protein [Nocardioides sp. GY 10113]